METTVKLRGVSLNVHFRYEGQYFAATQENPPEYPELHIDKITAEDSNINIMELLDWRDIEEIENIIEG